MKIFSSRVWYVAAILLTIVTFIISPFAFYTYLENNTTDRAKYERIISDPKAKPEQVESARRILKYLTVVAYSRIAFVVITPLVLAVICVMLTIDRRRRLRR